MRLTRILIPAAAFVLTVGIAGIARPQTATESESTVTTAPAVPSVTSKTVTRKEVINPPPPVVVTPPPATSETTTETDTADSSAPVVQQKERSKTSYGPLGVTHSESTEKSTSY
jgi:hypothetical protein